MKLDDTQKEWKQIVVKQGEHIKKLAEQNKAQDVIISKLNTDYNIKHGIKFGNGYEEMV